MAPAPEHPGNLGSLDALVGMDLIEQEQARGTAALADPESAGPVRVAHFAVEHFRGQKQDVRRPLHQVLAGQCEDAVGDVWLGDLAACPVEAVPPGLAVGVSPDEVFARSPRRFEEGDAKARGAHRVPVVVLLHLPPVVLLAIEGPCPRRIAEQGPEAKRPKSEAGEHRAKFFRLGEGLPELIGQEDVSRVDGDDLGKRPVPEFGGGCKQGGHVERLGLARTGTRAVRWCP